MHLFSRYRQLPLRRRRALWLFLFGTLLMIYGVLGLLGVIPASVF